MTGSVRDILAANALARCHDTLYAGVMTPDSIGTMPNTPGTPRRTIRVEDVLWTAALAAAETRGESLPEAIRQFLKRYAKSK